jgi:hypothetical protein
MVQGLMGCISTQLLQKKGLELRRGESESKKKERQKERENGIEKERGRIKREKLSVLKKSEEVQVRTQQSWIESNLIITPQYQSNK